MKKDSNTGPVIPSLARLHSHDPHRRFFGRRKGQPLSKRKEDELAEWLPKLDIPLPKAGLLDIAALFDTPKRAYWLEIGFGKGEHLAWQAEQNPDIGFIGCEPFINGVAGLVSLIADKGLTNIRIYRDDARHVLDLLPDNLLERIFLLHPDPWPKKRHAWRRFVGQDNLDLLARVMVDGGEFRVASDHPLYRSWTAVQMAQRTDFCWLAERMNDWLERPQDWPKTRYEAKALEGRPAYFRYRKVEKNGSVSA